MPLRDIRLCGNEPECELPVKLRMCNKQAPRPVEFLHQAGIEPLKFRGIAGSGGMEAETHGGKGYGGH